MRKGTPIQIVPYHNKVLTMKGWWLPWWLERENDINKALCNNKLVYIPNKSSREQVERNTLTSFLKGSLLGNWLK